MERRFHGPVIVATLFVVPLMVLQGVDPGRPWSTVGYLEDWPIWLIFLAEVAAMLSVTAERWRRVRSNPLGLKTVVLTPPVTPAVVHTGRILRLLRLVRLFRGRATRARDLHDRRCPDAAFLDFVTLIVGAQAFLSSEPKSQSVGQGDIETLANQDATHAGLDAIARRLDRLALTTAAPPVRQATRSGRTP